MLFAGATSLAHSASFDCTMAATAIEKTICSDSRLSDLDSQLNQSYKKLLSASTNPYFLKSEQRDWLATVRNKCQDAACLGQAYTDRIARLDGITALATTPLSQAAAITNPKDQPSPNDTAVTASEPVEVSNPSPVQHAVMPSPALPKAETATQAVTPTSSLPTSGNAASPSTTNPGVGITDVFHVLFAIGMLALIAGMVRPTLASKWIAAPTRKKIFGLMLVYLIPVAALSNFTKTPERIAFDESVKKQSETERLEKELIVQKKRETERLAKAAQQPPESNRSGNAKITVAQIGQLNDVCLKLGMYSLAYMELKSTGQDSHPLYSSMDSWLEEYPLNIRPAVKTMWLKTFSMVDNARDPRMYGSSSQKRDASIELAAACQNAVKRLAN